jgi:hypothetical protein
MAPGGSGDHLRGVGGLEAVARDELARMTGPQQRLVVVE